jgi:uncharacterized repeat protein (TIGR02543 family)
MPADPSRTGYTFDGWWTKDGSGDGIWGAEFTADSTVAILPDPLPVYAKWTADGPGGQGNINITVNITYSTDTPFVFSYTGTGDVNQDTPQDITITISNASSFAGATFKWYDDKNPASPVTGTSYTVPFSSSSNVDYLLPGKHIIYVVAEIDGYAQHSGPVEIEVKVTP